jgi:hypothetical protein
MSISNRKLEECLAMLRTANAAADRLNEALSKALPKTTPCEVLDALERGLGEDRSSLVESQALIARVRRKGNA